MVCFLLPLCFSLHHGRKLIVNFRTTSIAYKSGYLIPFLHTPTYKGVTSHSAFILLHLLVFRCGFPFHLKAQKKFVLESCFVQV